MIFSPPLTKINELDLRPNGRCRECGGKGYIVIYGWTSLRSKFCKNCNGKGFIKMSLKDCVVCDKQYFTRKEDQNMCDTCQAKNDEKRFYVVEMNSYHLCSKDELEQKIKDVYKASPIFAKQNGIKVFELINEYEVKETKTLEVVKIK